jgi:hypothetical protein
MSIKTALKHMVYAVRGKLKNTFLVVCAFAAFGGVSALAQAPVKITIKVCVADENGPAVDAKLTLVNAPGKIYRPDGSCYKTDELPLRPGQVYFILATTVEQKFASAPLVVQPTDKGKEIPVSLQLQKLNASPTTSIEICLKDKNDLPISIKDISLSGGSNSKSESGSEQDCSRLIVQQAPEYKVTVHGDPVVSTVVSVGFGAGHYLLLLLAIISLGALGVVFFRVNQLPRTAKQKSIDEISADLRNLLQNTSKLEESITAWRKEGGGTTAEKSDRDSGVFFFKNEFDLDELNAEETALVSNPSVETVATAPETHLTGSGRTYAKQQYSSFSRGEFVDHFFLMPSGSSSAADMVEGAKIALREQKQGTYVAFRSIDNENEAWVFPKPHRDFTPETFGALFPDLTAQQYESGDIDPKTAVITEPKLWKLQD